MPPISKPQILVVDDDPGIRESLGMLLASEGYDVATADDGIAMSGDYQVDGVPAGIIADSFYPKGQNLSNLLTTIANLIAANPARWNAQESRPGPALDS